MLRRVTFSSYSLGNTIIDATIPFSVTIIMTQFVAFTIDVYSHIIERMQSDAMAIPDEVLPAGVNGAREYNANLTPIIDITSFKTDG